MKTAIVTITSDPVESFIPITDEASFQIARSLVQIGDETPAEHISIWSSGELISLSPSEGLWQKLKASNPAAVLSFVVKDSEGFAWDGNHVGAASVGGVKHYVYFLVDDIPPKSRR